MMNKSHLLSFALTVGLGLAGVGLVLFAWQLPPFSPSQPTTENAYIRGSVTNLSPQISGYISEVLVSDFQEVKAGEVLFRLDARSLEQKLHQAKAKLTAAQASRDVAGNTLRATELAMQANVTSLQSAELALSNARAENTRQHSLQERGILSSSATEQADLALSKATAQLAELEATLAAQQEKLAALSNQILVSDAMIAEAEASVTLAQIDLDHVEISAPTDGTMGQVSARVGQYVNAATALASLVGTNRWVIANFTETHFDRLAADQPVSIAVDALGGKALSGRISRFSPATGSEFSLVAGTNASGNFTKVVQRIPVRIEIDADQPLESDLLPGMSVIVKVQPAE